MSKSIIAPHGENKNPSKPDQRPWEESFLEQKIKGFFIYIFHIMKYVDD